MNTIECAFIGRLATDPEARTSQSGNAWCRFRCVGATRPGASWESLSPFASGGFVPDAGQGDSGYLGSAIFRAGFTTRHCREAATLQAYRSRLSAPTSGSSVDR
jgi:hypothetical protein